MSASEWNVHLDMELAKTDDNLALRIEQNGAQLIGWVSGGTVYLGQI